MRGWRVELEFIHQRIQALLGFGASSERHQRTRRFHRGISLTRICRGCTVVVRERGFEVSLWWFSAGNEK